MGPDVVMYSSRLVVPTVGGGPAEAGQTRRSPRGRVMPADRAVVPSWPPVTRTFVSSSVFRKQLNRHSKGHAAVLSSRATLTVHVVVLGAGAAVATEKHRQHA